MIGSGSRGDPLQAQVIGYIHEKGFPGAVMEGI